MPINPQRLLTKNTLSEGSCQKQPQQQHTTTHNNTTTRCFHSRVPIFCVTFQAEPLWEAHGSPRQCRTAAETATTALVVATRAAVDRCGAGYGVPPLVLQGGHRERRPTGTEDWHQHRGGPCRFFLSSFRTMAGPLGRSGQRHCLSRGRRGKCSDTQASGTDSPRISMFLCCTLWTSCRTSFLVAEQVIDVPKISQDKTQQRLGDCLRQPQTADQLVEVPMIVSYASFSAGADSCSSWSRRSWRRGRPSRFTTRTGFNSTNSGAGR